MENTKTDYTEKLFIKIFEYGNENSGSLMYDRFLHDFDKDVKEFKNSLCTIDLNKWNKYFYSEPLKELKKKINDNRNFVSADCCHFYYLKLILLKLPVAMPFFIPFMNFRVENIYFLSPLFM